MKNAYFVRDPSNYDVDAESFDSGLACEDESRTIQSQAEDADINVIVRRFGITGVVPQNLAPPTYADFEGIFDFQTAQNALIKARDAFMQLPGDVRKRFGNDPGEFVMFCSDESNLEEMRKLGLAVPKKEAAVTPPPDGASKA